MAHLNEVPARPSTLNALVPSDLEAVLLRCLSKDPETRFDDVHALDLALAGCGSAGEWGEDEAAAWWSVHAPGAAGGEPRLT
jgi:serine/threonine-protein kinase